MTKKNNKGGQGKNSPMKTAGLVPSCTAQVPEEDKNEKQNKLNTASMCSDKANDSEISISGLVDEDAGWEEKFRQLELTLNVKIETLNAKVETLTQVMESKDVALAKLNQENGYLKSELINLKQCANVLSQETTDIKNSMEIVQTRQKQEISTLQEKTTDLEDRSRRNNLVFYGIKEQSKPGEPEDCEDLILKEVLFKSGIITNEDLSGGIFDRAHRLGPIKSDQDRPRPIIARFTAYKDKEIILKNSFKLKGTSYGIAEDFSKATLDIRSQMVAKAKIARDKHQFIKGFRLNYRRITLKYENPDGKSTYFKSYGFSDTLNDPNWYLPNNRTRL